MNSSHVYEIIDRAGSCHYVGKTDDPVVRWNNHLKGKLWIDNHMRAHSDDGWKMVLVETLDRETIEEAAKETLLGEQCWIAFHRVVGSPLKNLTPGGDSPWPMSSESVEKHRNSVRLAHSRTETKEKHRTAVKIACARPEVKSKRSSSQKIVQGIVQQRPEVKENHRIAAREIWSRPGQRALHSEATKQAMSRPDVVENIRLANLRPDVQRSRSEAAKRRWAKYRGTSS